MKNTYNEIRLDQEGKKDDIVLNCDSIHLERMDNNCWCLIVYKKNKRTLFNLIAEQDGINANLEENGLNAKIIPMKNLVSGKIYE